MKTNFDRNTSSMIIMILVLIVYSLLIIFTQHYERLTADTTLYLDLAEKYITGDFANAINGYWGPLLSWLFIPFLYFKVSPVTAVTALNLIVGSFTILGTWILSYRFEFSEKIRGAIILSLLPIMLYYALVGLFDLLLLCFLVYYLGIIFSHDYNDKLSKGIFCGILGALAYFSKSYAFPFFLVHFLIMNVLHYIRSSAKSEKRNVMKNAISGIVVFAVISSLWIAAISMKYDHLTFSNQGKGNFAPIGPDDPEQGFVRGVVIFHKGLFPPTNDTATSAWEDPSLIWKNIKSWSPLDSALHLKHFIKNILRNIFDTLDILIISSMLSIAIFIASVLLLIAGPSTQLFRGDRLYTFVTIFVYVGGYLPFHLEYRYLWTVIILLLLMGGHVLNVMFQNAFFNKKIVQNVLIVIFALSFMLTPLRHYARAGNNNMNKEMYHLGTLLKDKYQIQGNLASNREWEHVAIHDSWHKTFRLSFWLNSQYYGQTQAVVSDDDLAREFKKHNIDYYFVWGESPSIPRILSQYEELTHGEFSDLKIYSLKEKNN